MTHHIYIFNGGNPPVTNPQLLSLLSRPHHGGILTGGNVLGNHFYGDYDDYGDDFDDGGGYDDDDCGDGYNDDDP